MSWSSIWLKWSIRLIPITRNSAWNFVPMGSDHYVMHSCHEIRFKFGHCLCHALVLSEPGPSNFRFIIFVDFVDKPVYHLCSKTYPNFRVLQKWIYKILDSGLKLRFVVSEMRPVWYEVVSLFV